MIDKKELIKLGKAILDSTDAFHEAYDKQSEIDEKLSKGTLEDCEYNAAFLSKDAEGKKIIEQIDRYWLALVAANNELGNLESDINQLEKA